MSSCVSTHTQEDVVKVEKALVLARSELETQLGAVSDTSSATDAAVLCVSVCVSVRARMRVRVCVPFNSAKNNPSAVL